mmetsp:Transcript_4924/g.31511  ORF Transcript_4924/g.31511 Transcript_4924/m.31511 type:complete len:246 (-) Transcript_4924:816-1553(-)
MHVTDLVNGLSVRAISEYFMCWFCLPPSRSCQNFRDSSPLVRVSFSGQRSTVINFDPSLLNAKCVTLGSRAMHPFSSSASRMLFLVVVSKSATCSILQTSKSCIPELAVGKASKPERGCTPAEPATSSNGVPLAGPFTPCTHASIFMEARFTTRTELSSIRTATLALSGHKEMEVRIAPRRGRNSCFPVSSCHITSTPSSPPDSRCVPSSVKAKHLTDLECQWRVVTLGVSYVLFLFPPCAISFL